MVLSSKVVWTTQMISIGKLTAKYLYLAWTNVIEAEWQYTNGVVYQQIFFGELVVLGKIDTHVFFCFALER